MPFFTGIILHLIIQHRDTESAEAAEDVRGSDHPRLLKFALMYVFFFWSTFYLSDSESSRISCIRTPAYKNDVKMGFVLKRLVAHAAF